MGFLTPLYLLAGIAVSLPILFHLIRRTPRGRQEFSSLMFLVPSPPRVTKRSRIEDWLLLILRACALILLALAFARPFLRAQADTSVDETEIRRWAILLDTSASMRRTGYWEQARLRLEEVLRQTEPQDVVSITLFDESIRPLITADEWSGHPAPDRPNLAAARLKSLEPGWLSTALATAVIRAAEDLDDQTEKHVSERVVVLISDLQAGSAWEPLRDYSWPETVSVRLEPVGEGLSRTNATVHTVFLENQVDNTLRLRVSNAADASRETFRILGHPGTRAIPREQLDELFSESEVSVYVPPGQARVVKTPEVTKHANLAATAVEQGREAPSVRSRNETPNTAWVLLGDDEEFDNTCFVAPSKPWNIRLLYLGDDEATDTSGLRFFLGPVFPSDSRRTVIIDEWDAATNGRTASEVLSEVTAVVVAGTMDEATAIPALRTWMAGGGLVLFVARTAEQGEQLYELQGTGPAPVAEADIKSYSMLADPDFDHPVLAPFSDPRFSDFTRLKVWKHRIFDFASLPTARVLLKFDDGSPALTEIQQGEGRVFVFATGWNRGDSELALWSKFVPLMNGLLEYGGRQPVSRLQFTVGDRIVAVKEESGQVRVVSASQIASKTSIRKVAGTMITPASARLPVSADAPHSLLEPGVYQFIPAQADESEALLFAVNLAPDESRTEPLSREVLEAAGIQLHIPKGSEKQAALELRERQLLNHELESRQQIWRWLLVGALVLLLLESALSGRIARQRLVEATASN